MPLPSRTVQVNSKQHARKSAACNIGWVIGFGNMVQRT